jgi:hypothetical protein
LILRFAYWRQGAFDEARVLLQEALARPDNLECDVRAIGIVRSVIVEESTMRLHDCLHLCAVNREFFETLSNTAIKGKFHNEFGMVLKDLGVAEQRQNYIDHALIEFTVAGVYCEQAHLSRHQACVENNIGFLFGTIKKFPEAHEPLDRAQALFTRLKGYGTQRTGRRIFHCTWSFLGDFSCEIAPRSHSQKPTWHNAVEHS